MRRGRGFTLVEIMLVVTIGMTLLFSATVIYNVAKNSAAAAQGRSKVLALQTLVEQIASAQGRLYPDLDQLSQIWAQRRPNDYNTSPWGGAITHGCPDGNAGQGPLPATAPPFVAGLAGQGGNYAPAGSFESCYYGDLVPGVYSTPFPAPAGSASVGELDYRRISGNATASFFDDTLNNQVQVQSYAISIRVKDDNDAFYVGGIGQ